MDKELSDVHLIQSILEPSREIKEGFETVYNLKGGILAWQNAGMPLIKEAKESKRKKKKQK